MQQAPTKTKRVERPAACVQQEAARPLARPVQATVTFVQQVHTSRTGCVFLALLVLTTVILEVLPHQPARHVPQVVFLKLAPVFVNSAWRGLLLPMVCVLLVLQEPTRIRPVNHRAKPVLQGTPPLWVQRTQMHAKFAPAERTSRTVCAFPVQPER